MTSHLLPALLPLGCIVCWTSAACAALPLLAVCWRLLKRGFRGAPLAPLPGGVTTPPRRGPLHRLMHLLRACRRCRLYGVEERAEGNSGCSCPSCSGSSAAREGVGLPTPDVSTADKANALKQAGWGRRSIAEWVDPMDGRSYGLGSAYAILRATG